MKYPFLDLGVLNRPFAEELKEAAARVVDSGRYIGGAEVEAFERNLAAMCQVPHVVGVSNGLDALRLIFV
ncbi:MAG: DegT/DnrJ/EryC1/StrS family aminotransferase [Muribaculaceae bacterium]|nr:DegT/DnrJ/EryC1/StrS family aminotransferase [Muribaculaceae bacterium]